MPVPKELTAFKFRNHLIAQGSAAEQSSDEISAKKSRDNFDNDMAVFQIIDP